MKVDVSRLAIFALCAAFLTSQVVFFSVELNWSTSSIHLPNPPRTLVLSADPSPSWLNDTIKQFNVPTRNSGPEAIIPASNDTFWFSEFAVGKVAEFFASNSTFKEFAIPEQGAQPAGLALDRFGNLWFADENNSGSIWMFAPGNGSFKQFKTQTENSIPVFVAVDSQNNIWFTEDGAGKIGELSYPSYSMTEFSLPTPNSGPAELAIQPGTSFIWITESGGNKIAKFDTNSHAFTEFNPGVPINSPVGVVTDSEGNVWFSEHGGSSIDELIPSNSTFIKFPTSVPPPHSAFPRSAPATLAIDRNGHLWFVEHFSNKVGRLNPGTGVIDEFDIPTTGAYSVFNALDANGNFWFTEYYSNQIGTIGTNALTPMVVAARQVPVTSVSPGQSVQTQVTVSNRLSSSIRVTLGVSSTFTSSGQTTSEEVSLNASSLSIDPGQSKVVSVSISPASGLSSGLYSVGVVAGSGNDSDVGVIFLSVQSPYGFLATLGSDISVIVIAVLVVAAGLYFFVVRRGVARVPNKIRMVKTALAITISGLLLLLPDLSLVFISQNRISLRAEAKCPGLPQPPPGQPDPYSIILDVVSAALVVAFIFYVVRDYRKNRRLAQEEEEGNEDDEAGKLDGGSAGNSPGGGADEGENTDTPG